MLASLAKKDDNFSTLQNFSDKVMRVDTGWSDACDTTAIAKFHEAHVLIMIHSIFNLRTKWCHNASFDISYCVTSFV